MKNKIIFSALIFLNFTISCKKGTSTQTSPQGINTSGVYVAGFEKTIPGFTQNGYKVAKYWKDGVPIALTDGTRNAVINDIFVTDDAVYCCGYEQNSNFEYKAKYWVNGLGRELPDGIQANSIYVENGNVYIVGLLPGQTIIDKCCIWINGIRLRHYIYDYSYMNDITSNKGEIYVCGETRISPSPNTTNTAMAIWKNHSLQTIIPKVNLAPVATKLKVINNDVYVCGVERSQDSSKMKFWKNGSEMYTTDGTLYESPSDFVIDGSDVYISGSSIKKISVNGGPFTYENRPKYWKNGIANILSLPNLQSVYGVAVGIGLQGKDVILGGYIGSSNNINMAVVWKNGVRKDLTDGTKEAQVTSFFIK